MKENRKFRGVFKNVLKLLTAAALIIAAIGFITPGNAQAADKVIRKTIKAGKSDSSVKLTKEKNIVIYEIDVPKDNSELGINVSAGSVSDRLIFTFSYKADDNTSIYRSEVFPEGGGKVDEKLSFGVLKSGKYFLSVSGEGTNTTTGTIKVETKISTYKLQEKEDNNSYKKAQTLPLDGEGNRGLLCNLSTYGLDVDTEDWYVFTTKSEGFYLRGEIVKNSFATAQMELYEVIDSKPSLKFTYYLTEPQEKVLKSLPAGKYYLRVMWIDALTQKGFSENQALYSVSVAPYKELKGLSLNKSKLTLTTKGSTSKATLVPELNPSDAIPRSISWTSSKSSVATVKNGVVRAEKKGTATITCTVTDVAGYTKSVTCKVTVKKK